MKCVIGIVLLSLAFIVQKGEAITCFTCDQIPFPRDCKTVVKCGDHEECFTDRIVTDDGNAYFNIGCRDKQRCAVIGKRALAPVVNKRQDSFQTTVCSSCCSDDHCNYGGCGAAALPAKDQRGPICYSCSMMQDPKKCNQVNLCSRDELCEVLKTPHPTFDVTYTAKCGTKALCDRLSGLSHGFGKRVLDVDQDVNKRGFALCFRCCKGDLCNLGCTAPNATTTTSTTMMSSTSASTTSMTSTTMAPTTKTTTMPPTTTASSMSTTAQSSTMTSSSASMTSSSASMTSSSASMSSSSASMTSNKTSSSLSPSVNPNPTFATNSSMYGCLPDYIYYGKSCYYFSKTSLYWEPSRKFCKDHGSDLVIINDATENNLIVQHLKQLTAQHVLPTDLWAFYIGAHYVNGTWKWVDNTDLTYTHWATKEPDNQNSQIYGSIYLPSSGYYNYEWASHKDMYTTAYFICEFKQP